MDIRLPVTLSHRGEELPTQTAVSKYIKIRSIYYMDCIISPFPPTYSFTHNHTQTHSDTCIKHAHRSSGPISRPSVLLTCIKMPLALFLALIISIFYSAACILKCVCAFFLFLCLPLCERHACGKRYINKRNVTSDCLGDRFFLFLRQPPTELRAPRGFGTTGAAADGRYTHKWQSSHY